MFTTGYMDDLYLIGNRSMTVAATTRLSVLLSEIGLVVNKSKTVMLDFTCQQEHDIHEGYCTNNKIIVALGGPVGKSVNEIGIGKRISVSSYLEESLSKKSALVDKVSKNMPPKDAYKLLRCCINTRANYLTRVCHPNYIEDAAYNFDHSIDKGIANIINYAAELPENSKIIRGLPYHLGGLSMRRVVTTFKPAFVASLLSAIPNMSQLIWALIGDNQDRFIPHYITLIKGVLPHFDKISTLEGRPKVDLDRNAQTMPENLTVRLNQANVVDCENEENGDQNDEDPGTGNTQGNEHDHAHGHIEATQKELTEIFDKSEYYKLTRKMENSDLQKNLASLLSSRARYTATWAHSTIAHRTLSQEAYVTALRNRLILPFQDTVDPNALFKCSHCSKTVTAIDSNNHALNCNVQGCKTRRHNRIKEIIVNFLRRILPLNSVQVEVVTEGKKVDILRLSIGDHTILMSSYVARFLMKQSGQGAVKSLE
jgi:hypothetical protein